MHELMTDNTPIPAYAACSLSVYLALGALSASAAITKAIGNP
jgi:hypothetical protein